MMPGFVLCQTMWRSEIRFLVFCFLLAGMINACHPVPESLDRPVVTASWDTLGKARPLLLPGDTLLVTADMASQTNTSSLIIEAYRIPLPYLEYRGPDSDFAYQKNLPVGGRVNANIQHTLPIASSALPGNYRLLCRVQDSDQRWSDSAKSTFFLVRYDYPVLIMNAPVPNGTVTRLVDDTAKFNLRAAGAGLEFIRFQWFDSTRKTTLAPPILRNMVGAPNDLTLDTFVLGDPSFPIKMNLQIGLRNIDGREMLYWLPYKRN